MLTDFGAAVDSLRPKRQMCSSSPAAPVPQFGGAASNAATGPRESTFASLPSVPRQSSVSAGDGVGAAGAATGAEGKSGDTDKESFLATTTTPRCQPTTKQGLSVSERPGLTAKRPAGIEVDEDVSAVSAASPARKRRRHGVVEESGGKGADQQGGVGPEAFSTALSDKLLLPFSKYCVTGTPSILAPELARAWREEKDLDFRRSDVSQCWLSSSTCEHHCPF